MSVLGAVFSFSYPDSNKCRRLSGQQGTNRYKLRLKSSVVVKMSDYIAIFVFFFAVIDPIGTVPVFIAVTSGFEEKVKRKIALHATFASACILLFFIVAGELILTAIDVPLPAFQIAGGLVLFLFALTMIFGESKPEEELKMTTSSTQTAIFPLAVPSIASPGAMLAAVLLTENRQFSLVEQLQTAAIMLFFNFLIS